MELQQKNPKVSVVMPLFNAERFIEQAIRSVMDQTVTDWELIVIDDCSSDSSFRLAQKLEEIDSRIRVLRNAENCGVARTRNRGIGLSRGEYIAFLDSDDYWYPTKLERQFARMTEAEAPFCYCSYGIVDAEGKQAKADYLVPGQVSYQELLKENVIQCSSMLIRADIVKRIQFNPDFYHEDYVLGLQILMEGHKAVGCTEVLFAWRYLENSRSFNKWNSAKNRWRIYRNFLNFSLPKSAYLFANYAAAGLRKYSGRA